MTGRQRMLEIQMQLKGKEMLMLAEKIEQFLDVSEKVLSKTRYITANVWKNGATYEMWYRGEVSQEIGRSSRDTDDNEYYGKIWWYDDAVGKET